MRGEDFLDKMELIDPVYVEAADALPKRKRNGWLRFGATAACLVLILLAAVSFLWPREPELTYIGGIPRQYKEVQITENASAIVWPWEYLLPYEKYTTIDIYGAPFSFKARLTEPSVLQESMGVFKAVGYDIYTEGEYRIEAEVYKIKGISEELLVGVKIEEEFCVFRPETYAPPKRFAEVLDGYSLEHMIRFERFTAYEGFSSRDSYRLEEDAPIWKVLTQCREAPFVEDDVWDWESKEYISFAVTSEPLGVYKRVFYVSSDGYIRTNVFDWAYTFEIGEPAAEQILSYATEHGVETEPESYTETLSGTVVAINEDYIFVDDSILCTDPGEGMVFKISLQDLRIRRCVEFGGISAGDIVVVSFDGNIQVEAGNELFGACSISPGAIVEGNVLVAE